MSEPQGKGAGVVGHGASVIRRSGAELLEVIGQWRWVWPCSVAGHECLGLRVMGGMRSLSMRTDRLHGRGQQRHYRASMLIATQTAADCRQCKPPGVMVTLVRTHS